MRLFDDAPGVPGAPDPFSLRSGPPSHPPRRVPEASSRRFGLGLAGTALGVLYVEIDNFSIFSAVYGAGVAEALVAVAETHIQSDATDPAGVSRPLEGRFLRLERVDAGSLAVLVDVAGADGGAELLAEIAANLSLELSGAVKQEAIRRTGRGVEVRLGWATLRLDGMTSFRDVLFEAVSQARSVAYGATDAVRERLMEEFRSILAVPRVRTVYQPIVDLRSGAVFGWEALSRGPEGSHFQSPAALFDFAEENESIFALERAARETAIRSLGGLGAGETLFLNVHPRTLADPRFTPGETMRFLEAHGLAPHNVVLEITERHSIRDFSLFLGALEHYRGQGYRIAVDDVGAGYSGLRTIAEIRPDFIKIDMGLTRGVDKEPVKRAMVETFAAFAEKIGCRIVAEGVESDAELTTLIRIGAHFGQGYHICRPGPVGGEGKPQPSPEVGRRIVAIGRRTSSELKCSVPIRELAEPTLTVLAKDQVSVVKRRLIEEGGGVAAVVEDGRPVGLVMSHCLDRVLSTPYGMSLYYQREIARLMDVSALVVEADQPVEQTARLAMARERGKLYDHVMVAEDGRLLGVASVQRMLDVLAAAHVEMAKGANPLTGLPGNLSIEREAERRARSGNPASFIYADLDNFKAFNDAYGFKVGDAAILLLAEVLAKSLEAGSGAEGDFLGHVGGDDFVAFTHPDRVEAVCEEVVREFGRMAAGLHAPEDLRRGYLVGRDRATGRERRFPLLSVSLAVVDVNETLGLETVARRAAEMKKYVKTLPGNAWARDRRVRDGG